jgi:hypothetical protein
MVVEVWREGLGWWAATAHGRSQRGYTSPEAALAALTGSWSDEPWLRRVGDAARRLAGTRPSTGGELKRATRTVVPIRNADRAATHPGLASRPESRFSEPEP